MKYPICLFLFMMAMIACTKNSDNDCNIEGRWELGEFDNTLYEFKDGLRHTIYATDSGEFGSLETSLPTKHEYMMQGDSLIIDLNFANYIRAIPQYKCDCNVVELVRDGFGTFLYKEGYDRSECE